MDFCGYNRERKKQKTILDIARQTGARIENFLVTSFTLKPIMLSNNFIPFEVQYQCNYSGGSVARILI